MATPGPEKERKRLAELYSGMNDGELQKLAAEGGLLSDAAREALRSEISRRGLDTALSDSVARDVAPPPPVILRRFLFLAEALLDQSILDSAGIECFLADEHMIRMNWLRSLAVGCVKLWVRAEDADAVELLDAERPESFDVEGVGEYKQPRCPNCGSFDISYRELIKLVAFAGLYVGLPIRLHRLGWKCHDCGHSWQGSDEPAEAAP